MKNDITTDVENFVLSISAPYLNNEKYTRLVILDLIEFINERLKERDQKWIDSIEKEIPACEYSITAYPATFICDVISRLNKPAPTIKTALVKPPIPIRSFDWVAYVDGMEENSNYVAYGETEKEAKDALQEKLDEGE